MPGTFLTMRGTFGTAPVAGRVPSVSGTAGGLIEVFSPAIHTQLNGAVGAAGQGCSGPSGTSVAAPRRRLLPGGIRHSLAQGLDLQRFPTQASAEGRILVRKPQLSADVSAGQAQGAV